MEDAVVVARDDGEVRILTLNRPDKLNAFSNQLYTAAADSLSDAAEDDAVSVVVLTGNGRAFSAGQDLGEMAALATGASEPSAFPSFVDELQGFPKPLLAAVNGLAVGIGFTLLAHCDLVLADSSARFRAPFTALGVAPEAGSSVLFPARMGWQQAARVLLTSDWVSADEAVRLGLVLQVCPDGTVLSETLSLAHRIAEFPLASLMATKRVMLDGRLPSVKRARQIEDAAFAAIFEQRRPS